MLHSIKLTDTKATVYLRHYDDAGVQVDIPFSISESVPKAVKINIDETIANGMFVTQIDKEKYLQGDNVVFTAKGDKGYYYNHIELDGVSVVLGSDGYQTFKAEKDVHNITGSFAPAIFDDHGNFVLTNQNVGLLATNVASNTGYIATKGNYNELTLTAKAPESGNFGLGGQFYFELGETDKWVTFRIHNEGHNDEYYIQCASGSAIYKNNIYYKLTADEIAQLKSEEGIEFKAVRTGTNLEFYLGGNQIKDILVNGSSVGSSLDLTKDISGKATGITAETTSIVKIQRWFVGGSLVEIPFKLK